MLVTLFNGFTRSALKPGRLFVTPLPLHCYEGAKALPALFALARSQQRVDGKTFPLY